MATYKLSQLNMPDGHTYEIDAKYLNGRTLEQIIAQAVEYKGLVSATNQLPTDASYGDFVRVSEGFTDSTSGKNVHAGDLLVANKETPAQNLDPANWVIVHGEEGNLITHSHPVDIPGHEHSFTPTAHSHSFTGTQAKLNFTPAGSVSISKGTGTANYTPEGDITNTVTGTEMNVASVAVDVSHKDHEHSVTASGKT